MPPSSITPSSLSVLSSRLIASLSEEATIAAKLLSLLEEEPKVLLGRDHQAILELSHRKQNLAEQLVQGELARRRCLEGSGLPVDLPLLEKALKDAGAEEAAAACHHLKKIATACAEYNRSNGIQVETRLRHVRRALEIVTGRPPEVESYGPTYGQRNRLAPRGNGRSWAKA
ncbi:flagella synthesis protein FlgN [Gammaproteobacteria bacterium]